MIFSCCAGISGNPFSSPSAGIEATVSPSDPQSTESTNPDIPAAVLHFSDPIGYAEQMIFRNIPPETRSASVPILLYHHVTLDSGGGDAINLSRFREHMQAISDAGYTVVTFERLLAFVDHGVPLPEKSVLLTFDDGYASNLELAAPVLREYGMNATVFAIGVSIGKDTYKDTGVPMTPHFSLAEAQQYRDVIRVESHGFNVHEVASRDPWPIRNGVLQKEGESDEAYAAFFREDCGRMADIFREACGHHPIIFAYPHGLNNELTETVLQENGIRITLTIQRHHNRLTVGDPSCLLLMGRYTISNETSVEEVLSILNAHE